MSIEFFRLCLHGVDAGFRFLALALLVSEEVSESVEFLAELLNACFKRLDDGFAVSRFLQRFFG